MPRLRRMPLRTGLEPFGLFQRLRRRLPNAFLLESREGPDRLARYSILGADPVEFLTDRRGDDPFAVIREVLAQHRLDERPEGFACGLVGAVGYDAVAHTDLPGHAINGPTYHLGLFLDAVVHDHRTGATEYLYLDEDRSQTFEQIAADEEPRSEPLAVERVASNTSRGEFDAMVADVKARIREGETYQTVVSRRFDARYRGDLAHLYRRLQQENPSPYMYYLDFEPVQVLGSSPEMLLRVEDGHAETYPIAGTRPVATDSAADARARAELQADPKEAAEHLMLVDLARNDLGRISRVGSVEVTDYRRLESFANVHHLVSRVSGRLRPDVDAVEAFRSVFPAGTVTGAPKIRAMQILDRLEKDPRGLYAGAVGHFGLAGDADSAIAIRTLTADRYGHLSVQAGAGIVQDSVAENEWMETRHKAAAILPMEDDEVAA